MTEQGKNDKYIKCSKCRCKYINDDEHIKADFGYSRLNGQYKTCITCRSKRKTQRDQPHRKENDKTYYENNKEQILEYGKQYYLKQKLLYVMCVVQTLHDHI